MTNIQRYAEIKLQILKLETELDVLKDEVFSTVMGCEGETLATELGVFKITQGVKKWKYSDELEQSENELKERLKSAKKIEEINGTAELLSAPARLMFTLNKETK